MLRVQRLPLFWVTVSTHTQKLLKDIPAVVLFTRLQASLQNVRSSQNQKKNHGLNSSSSLHRSVTFAFLPTRGKSFKKKGDLILRHVQSLTSCYQLYPPLIRPSAYGCGSGSKFIPRLESSLKFRGREGTVRGGGGYRGEDASVHSHSLSLEGA